MPTQSVKPILDELPELPDGWRYEASRSNTHVVHIEWPEHGSVSIDFNLRVFNLGWTSAPRRGLDAELCRWLDASTARWLIYSSCNAESLARDLRRMPDLQVQRARVFDLFPHTLHYEVLTLLGRR